MDVNSVYIEQLQFKRRLRIHIQLWLSKERSLTNDLVVVGQDREGDLFSQAEGLKGTYPVTDNRQNQYAPCKGLAQPSFELYPKEGKAAFWPGSSQARHGRSQDKAAAAKPLKLKTGQVLFSKPKDTSNPSNHAAAYRCLTF